MLGALVLVLARVGAQVAASAETACPRAHLAAYAHNDYANARPLDDALRLGFRGAEADVFLVGDTLRLGHDRRAAARGKTLEAVYLAPLAERVARCGALTRDGAPFLLTVEIKERSRPTFDALARLVARYDALLRGPAPSVEIVLVGWSPPDSALPNSGAGGMPRQHRITRRGGPWPNEAGRVRLLSLDYGKTMGRPWVGARGRRRWLATLRAARAAAPEALLRVYNVPADAHIYAELLAAGVDLIGTKQLAATAALLSAPDVTAATSRTP